MKPCYRTYAPENPGEPAQRIGRTYRTMQACLKYAVALSFHFPYVEVNDDHQPGAKRLVAIARRGSILGMAA
jgi:hypothetical protein